MAKKRINNEQGFSLVEMSIVLAVISFLVGAIVYGIGLKEKSKSKAILSELNSYLEAVDRFKSKYNYYPGDLTNADRYFTGFAIDTSDGNGIVDTGMERNLFWIQLSQAKMIDQFLDFDADPTVTTDIVIGTNRPSSKVDGLGWTFLDQVNVTTTVPETLRMYNVFRFGGYDGTENLSDPVMPISAHRYLDSKIDAPNTPLEGKYIVTETTCLADPSVSPYTYSTDTSILCTGNMADSASSGAEVI